MTAPTRHEELMKRLRAEQPPSSIPLNQPAPTFQPPVVVYNPQPSNFDPQAGSGYFGDFASLVGKLFVEREDYGADEFGEDLRATVAKGREAWHSTMEGVAGFLQSPVETTGSIISEFVSESGNMISAVRSDPAGVVPMIARGFLQEYVEPTLTLFTGQKITEENGIQTATPDEIAQGVFSTVGLAAGVGVYARLATGYRQVSAGIGATRAQRIGVLGQNVAKEILVEGAAGATQQVIAHPEESVFEAVLDNIANPLVLLTGTGFGVLRTRSLNKASANAWLAENSAINASHDIPLAKQVAASADTPIADALTAVEDIIGSDSWLEAGVKRVGRGVSNTLVVLNQTADQMGRIYQDYGPGSVRPEKPKLTQVVPPTMMRDGSTVHFVDPFDALVFSSRSIKSIAEEYNIPASVVRRHSKNLDKAVLDSEVQLVKLGNKEVAKVRSIPRTDLPYAAATKANFYYSRTGTVLVTGTPLTKAGIEDFTRSGFVTGEKVTYKGAEFEVKKVTPAGKLTIDYNGKTIHIMPKETVRIADSMKGYWNKIEASRDMVSKFVDLMDGESPNKTFDFLVEQFLLKNKMPIEAASSFKNFVYRFLQEDVGSNDFLKIQQRFANEKAELYTNAVERKLDAQGYRIMPNGAGYKLLDVNGVEFSDFTSMEELAKIVSNDLLPLSVPDLLPSKFPLSQVGVYTPNEGTGIYGLLQKTGLWLKTGQSTSTWLRTPFRLAEDIGQAVGLPDVGFNFARGLEVWANSVNAAEQGIFKPVVKALNDLTLKTKNLGDEAKRQITQVLEYRELADLAKDLDDATRLVANETYEIFKAAGGTQAVLKAVHSMRTGFDSYGNKFKPKSIKPNMAKALETFAKIGGELTDEKFLRYIDALEVGQSGTRDDIIRGLNWDKPTLDAFNEAEKFYSMAGNVFKIEGQITGYAPWITKWAGEPGVFNNIRGKGASFIHELKRVGTTPSSFRVMEIDQLAYSYTKSAIHYKSPVTGGGTTGELMSKILDDLDAMREAGDASGRKVDMAPMEQWLRNIRGVPEPELVNARTVESMIGTLGLRNKYGKGFDILLDAITLSKLGARPILGLRDIVSAINLSLMYGADAAVAIFKVSGERSARIERLIENGQLPQFNPGDIVSRTGETMLSKATDFGMKLSLQPQTYKYITANLYIHTLDKSLEMITKAKGDVVKLRDLMGDLLDSGSAQSQEWFLKTAMVDPESAARGLAARNAHQVSNRFGRINNPLSWQEGSFGRAFGQFGSWSLNALTFMGEGILNSRSSKAALQKSARMLAFGGAVYGAGSYAGLKLHNWITNPLAMIPGTGPAFGFATEMSRMFEQMTSNDEVERRNGRSALVNSTNLFTPTVLQDMYKGSQVLEQTGNDYLALMTAAGFKFTHEKIGRPHTIGTGIRRALLR